MVLKRVLGTMCVAALMLCMVGCGADKPKESADKAVLAYAELGTSGVSDSVSATGMTKAQEDQISDRVYGEMMAAFREFPLSDKTVEDLTVDYATKLHLAMNIQTKIKKDDSEHPVVEVSAVLIDNAKAAQMIQTNPDLADVAQAMVILKQNNVPDEDAKKNPELQEAFKKAIISFLNEIPMTETRTFDVTCKMVKGDDGNMYWAPENPDALMNFLSGK